MDVRQTARIFRQCRIKHIRRPLRIAVYVDAIRAHPISRRAGILVKVGKDNIWVRFDPRVTHKSGSQTRDNRLSVDWRVDEKPVNGTIAHAVPGYKQRHRRRCHGFGRSLKLDHCVAPRANFDFWRATLGI